MATPNAPRGFVDSRKGPEPGNIANKIQRRMVYIDQKAAKNKDKRSRREARKKEAEESEEPVPKKIPKTIENTREFDETVVDPDDDEVMHDQLTDELANHLQGRPTKIMITTSVKAKGPDTYKFGQLLAKVIPESKFFSRRGFELKTIVKQAAEKGFSDLIVINEDNKKPNALVICHLPDGPTAHYKLSSIKYPKEIANHGKATMHYPEVIVNNFHTRLGHQVGRMLTALFPQVPEFEGRAVATFHNQRDYIFFRRHRYIFRNKEKCGLQELGPRFTLKLKSLQKGTFDTKFGEYEFLNSNQVTKGSRKKFFL